MTAEKRQDDLIQEYRECAGNGDFSEKKRAVLEGKIWVHAKDNSCDEGLTRKEYLKKALGVKHHHSQARYMIMNLPDDIRERVWGLIDQSEISLSQAEQLIREGRKAHREQGYDLSQAITGRIDQFLEERGPIRKADRKGVRSRRNKFKEDLELIARDYVNWRLDECDADVREAVAVEFLDRISDAENHLAYRISRELTAIKERREAEGDEINHPERG